jgi:starch synthase (maltosyl-transferring)
MLSIRRTVVRPLLDQMTQNQGLRDAAALRATQAPRLIVENVWPDVDQGRYAIRRTIGDTLVIEADAYGEGHDAIAVSLLWRGVQDRDWRETRMRPLGNDRFQAEFKVDQIGRYEFTVEAWRDEFAIYRDGLIKKFDAKRDVTLELEEGRRLLARIASETTSPSVLDVRRLVKSLEAARPEFAIELLTAPETVTLMRSVDPRPYLARLDRVRRVEVERKRAMYANWYELFPRSQSGDPDRHGTFADVIRRLPTIREMGFDVVYLTPIHPIGKTNRKGRNNSLKAEAGDPGSPYAIGSAEGGHDAIHPELGTEADFRALIEAAEAQGLEIALDIAFQASPDHPWLKTHPEWFDWRPDGTIRYAENPPKTYEDIVNVDFYAPGAKPALWLALRDVVETWVKRGVKTFRVDNPHTKPFPFWEWMINDIRTRYPDVIFLSEAFTRPKVMYRLAKIGFSQSYTYFTWRDTKADLTAYFTELAESEVKEFFRPNLFVNTHDINPDFLQNAPRSAFLIRAALAATLSGLWGIYNGYELCDNKPDAKRKEYADSEKYQLVAWDWDRPGNIRAEITQLNAIRKDNPALQSHLGARFLETGDDEIIAYEKISSDSGNVVIVAVCLNASGEGRGAITLPSEPIGTNGSLSVTDLVSGAAAEWRTRDVAVTFTPEQPYAIWRVR